MFTANLLLLCPFRSFRSFNVVCVSPLLFFGSCLYIMNRYVVYYYKVEIFLFPVHSNQTFNKQKEFSIYIGTNRGIFIANWTFLSFGIHYRVLSNISLFLFMWIPTTETQTSMPSSDLSPTQSIYKYICGCGLIGKKWLVHTYISTYTHFFIIRTEKVKWQTLTSHQPRCGHVHWV